MKIVVIYSEGDLKSVFPYDYEGRDSIMPDVVDALKVLGHEVFVLPADDTMYEKLKHLKNSGKVDLVFNVADEGYMLNTQLEPHIPAMLDLLCIPYTGSDYLCLGSSIDKVRTKYMLIANNLRTPKFKVFEKHLNEAQPPPINLELAYPLIVKPIREDGSIGIKRDAVVDSWKQLTHQVNAIISRYHQPALVEEFIDGRELNVGIVGYDENLILLPISEIIFNLPEGERNFVSYEAKWHCHSVYDLGTTPKCPAELDINLEHKLTALAKRAYRLMDIHDYGRIDFRVDNSSGEPYILEVNPNPDLSRDAGLARMAQAMGMTYENLIEWIIESAISRCLRK